MSGNENQSDYDRLINSYEYACRILTQRAPGAKPYEYPRLMDVLAQIDYVMEGCAGDAEYRQMATTLLGIVDELDTANGWITVRDSIRKKLEGGK